MRFSSKITVVLCAAFLMFNAALASDGTEVGKVILDGSAFEDGSKSWFLQDASFENGDQLRKSAQVLLHPVEGAPKNWSHAGTRISNVPVETDLTFTCQLRGTHPQQRLMVNAFAYDSADRLLKNWSKTLTTKPNEWIPFTDKYTAPANADYIALWIINNTKFEAGATSPRMVTGAPRRSLAVAPQVDKEEESKNEDDDTKYGATIPGWIDYTGEGDWEVGIDKVNTHDGASSAYIKSLRDRPTHDFGNLMQAIVPNAYLDQRVQLSAFVKTKLSAGGKAQLWMRVDGDWTTEITKPGTFDNMEDRPIAGDTDWTKYCIVTDIPANANHVAFGLMMFGTGTVWIDDVKFERVGKDVALTGPYRALTGCGKKEPTNMNFESLK